MRFGYLGAIWIVALIGSLLAGCDPSAIESDAGELVDSGAYAAQSGRRKLSGLNDSVGEACRYETDKISVGTCQEGLFCVPLGIGKNLGLCRIECGRTNSSNELFKVHAKCPKEYGCAFVKDHRLEPQGLFCVKPADKNLPCEAPFDDAACNDGLTCLPTGAVNTGDGQIWAERFLCKEMCSPKIACGNAQEECFYPDFAPYFNASHDGEDIDCNADDCEKDESNCSCDSQAGQRCSRLHPNLVEGVCVVQHGVCGQPVPLAAMADFKGDSFDGKSCNETSDDRYCEELFNRPGENQASSICVSSPGYDEGVCVAPCRGLNIKDLACPENHQCSTDISRRFGIIELAERAEGENISCLMAGCESGKVCPEQCQGQALECIPHVDAVAGHGFCGIYLGTCLKN